VSGEAHKPAGHPASDSLQSAGVTPDDVRALAKDAGFSDAGLVALPYAAEARDARRFREWVGKGRAGTMHYLERRTENGELARERVAAPFPWARSAIVCFASYGTQAPLSTESSERGSAWIARYAWSSKVDANGERRPSDYHKILLKRLKALESALHGRFGEFESRAYVDTGPVVERSLAVAAGVGWTGKNTCLIHPRLGSFGFLAVLLTSLEVQGTREQENVGTRRQATGNRDQGTERQGAREQESERTRVEAMRAGGGGLISPALLPGPPGGGLCSLGWESGESEPVEQAPESRRDGATTLPTSALIGHEPSPFAVPDRCGSCTRCIEACPTNALDVPYQMDATRCISYLTIEHKGPIAEELMPGMGRQVFGCDICQDVCPWNGKAARDMAALSDPTLSARDAERMGHPGSGVDADFETREELVNPALEWLAALDEAEFEKNFNGSPVRRAGWNGLRRNVAIAMGNSGLKRFAPQLEVLADAADEGLRSAARWALNRLRRV
jgi:epoxyqueuosine reductase QueG